MYDTEYMRFDLLFIVADPPSVVEGKSSHTLPKKIKTYPLPTLHVSHRSTRSIHCTGYGQDPIEELQQFTKRNNTII